MPEGHDDAVTAPTEEISLADQAPKVKEAGNSSPVDTKDAKVLEENQMPSKQQEEEAIKKKYGGLMPKKPSLISKDSERAFFDSADWALGKKSKGPLEALRPKLQPTPQTLVRTRSAYARAEEDGEDAPNGDELKPGENEAADPDGSATHCPDNQDRDQQQR